MPKYFSSATGSAILTLGTLFVGQGSACASESVFVSSPYMECRPIKTAVMLDFAFAPDDAKYLQDLRNKTGDQSVGRPKRPSRSVTLAE
jgi:hypothetical protein